MPEPPQQRSSSYPPTDELHVLLLILVIGPPFCALLCGAMARLLRTQWSSFDTAGADAQAQSARGITEGVLLLTLSLAQLPSTVAILFHWRSLSDASAPSATGPLSRYLLLARSTACGYTAFAVFALCAGRRRPLVAVHRAVLATAFFLASTGLVDRSADAARVQAAACGLGVQAAGLGCVAAFALGVARVKADSTFRARLYDVGAGAQTVAAGVGQGLQWTLFAWAGGRVCLGVRIVWVGLLGAVAVIHAAIVWRVFAAAAAVRNRMRDGGTKEVEMIDGDEEGEDAYDIVFTPGQSMQRMDVFVRHESAFGGSF